jgi:hypothetical protein
MEGELHQKLLGSGLPQRFLVQWGILWQLVRNSGWCFLFQKAIGVTMQELPSTVFLSNGLGLGALRSL